MSQKNLLLFDLDGTIINSAENLVNFANQLLVRHGYEPQPLEALYPLAGGGARAMLGLANAVHLRDEFLAEYQENSPLYAGAEETLAQLHWGLVTNKTRNLTEGFFSRHPNLKPAVIVCADDVVNRKPSAEPILRACEILGVEPNQDIYYFGDDKNDYLSARDAGLTFVYASYGFGTPPPAGDYPVIKNIQEALQYGQ